jgi:hypothetical protein
MAEEYDDESEGPSEVEEPSQAEADAAQALEDLVEACLSTDSAARPLFADAVDMLADHCLEVGVTPPDEVVQRTSRGNDRPSLTVAGHAVQASM